MTVATADAVPGIQGSVAAAPPEAAIRPCMVSYYFHPNYSGSSIQALNLSVHLKRLGASPCILSANLSRSSPHEVVSGIPVYRVPVAASPELQVPSFWAAAARFLWRHRGEVDLIHAHGTVQHGVVSIIGGYLRKPTILKVAMAGSDLSFERQGRLAGRVNRFAVNRFDRYIATTHAIAEEYETRQIAASKVRLIPNGVDTDIYRSIHESARRKLRHDLGFPDCPLVTCVAVINERKNIDGVLRIWHEAVKQGIEGHLALIGPVHTPGGPFYRRLQAFVEERGLSSRVSFLGRQDPVAPYLQASDLFLFPSRQEGMPNSVLEAMACGVPCLTSRSAGIEQILSDNANGFAIDVDDEAAFVRMIVGLLRDDAWRRRLGDGARQTAVSRFSLASVAGRYLQLYQELLRQTPSGAGE